ncbi:MAG: mitochondrial ATPase complex subunit ATP10 [Bacteroidota bacterium]|nr:mitochondrial ATPase complex subunit ATP10 [Bacteroidota bacterium]
MKIALLTLTLCSFTFIETPVGIVFPDLKAETLENKMITIPTDTKGKSTIISLAYSDEAEKDLQTWYEPMYDKFIAKTELMSDVYDINLYFVPMFTGTKEAAAAGAKKQMKETVQADIQPHIIVYKGAIDVYKEKLKMDDKKKPYIFVLDKDGKIIYSTSGAYTEDKMDEIEDKIE